MKFCAKCGSQLDDDAKFCYNCGASYESAEAPQETAPQPEQAPVNQAPEAAAAAAAVEAAPKKKINLKKLIIIGAAAAAAVVLIIVAIAIISSIASREPAFILGGGPDGKGGSYVVDSTGNLTTLKDVEAAQFKTSLNGQKAVFVTDDGNGDATYYYYNGKEASEITSDNVSNIMISNNGNVAVYCVPEEDDPYGYGRSTYGTVYKYENGKSTKIADEAVLCAVSPDGKTVAYYKKSANEETDAYGYSIETVVGYYNNGKEESLGKNVKPFAVSNGAKLVYYTKKSDSGENAMYVQSGTDDGNRVKLSTNVGSVYFNYDMTQIIYRKDSGYYLEKNGKDEAEKLTSGSFSFIRFAYSGASKQLNSYYFGGEVSISIVNSSSFDNAIVTIDGKLMLYANGEKTLLLNISSVGDYIITEDGKTIIYIKNRKLYSKKISDPDADPKELEEEVSSIAAVSSDGGTVAYLNTDREYMLKKGSGKAVRVADGSDIDSLTIMNGKLFYTSDGKLYSTSDGKNKSSVKIGNGSLDVKRVNAQYGLMIVLLSDGTDSEYYISTNGSSFKLCMSEEKQATETYGY